MPGFQMSTRSKKWKLRAPCHLANKQCYDSNGDLLDLRGDALSTNATLSYSNEEPTGEREPEIPLVWLMQSAYLEIYLCFSTK